MATKYLDSAGVTYLWSKIKQYVGQITGNLFAYKKVTSGSTSISAADGLEEVAFEGSGSATVTLTNQAATQGTDAKAIVTVTTPTKLSDFTADSNSQHFTQTEKTKLSGIAAGAEVNQNAFSNVKVGSTTVAADGKTDTVEFAVGTGTTGGLTIEGDATNDKVTIKGKSETAASGGTTLSMVTTGDKYTWNNKQNAITSSSKLSADLIEDGTTNKAYTATEKTKLAGIASGAEVNQNAFSNVKVGSTTVAADSKTDTLELVAGDNVTLTPDATNDKVTIAVTDTQKVVVNVSGVGEGETLKDSDNNTISFNDLTALIAAKKDVVLTVATSGSFYQLIDSSNSYAYFGLTNVSTDETLSAYGYSISAGTGNSVNVENYLYSAPVASFTDPEMDGIASVGYDTTTYARGDHRHPSDTSKADKVSGATANNLAALDSDGNLIDSGVSATSAGTDTKNTAGSTNDASKLFIVGAKSQAANPQTYSQTNAYITAGKVYSNAIEVVNLSDTQALTNKTVNGLTLTKATTGFTVAGGTTSKTLTVNENYTLGAACAKAVDSSITAGSTSTNVPTTAAVEARINSAIQTAQAGAAMYQGTAPSPFAPTNYKAGYYWIVGTAGTYASATPCEPGDMIFAKADGTTYSASNFDEIQTNLDIASMTNSEIDAAIAAA